MVLRLHKELTFGPSAFSAFPQGVSIWPYEKGPDRIYKCLFRTKHEEFNGVAWAKGKIIIIKVDTSNKVGRIEQ